MAPLNSTKYLTATLIRHLNNNTVADHATIDARKVPSFSPTQTNRVVGIIIGGIVLGIIFTILMCRCLDAGGRDRDPPPDPGHVYGRDNASAIVLAAVRPVNSYERPRVQEVENRATVARPAPAVSRDSAVWDESPPPPCKYFREIVSKSRT